MGEVVLQRVLAAKIVWPLCVFGFMHKKGSFSVDWVFLLVD